MKANSYQSSEPRLCVTTDYLRPKPAPVEKIEGIKNITSAILKYLRAREPFFLADKKVEVLTGAPLKQEGDSGWLGTEFLLSDLRRAIGRQNYERDDEKIFEALDVLTDSGRLVISRMAIRHLEKSGDLFFKVLLGAGVLERFFPNSLPTIHRTVFFNKENRKIFNGGFIDKPSEMFQKMQADRAEALSARFGKIDLELESRLHREQILEEARFKAAVLRLAESLPKEDKKDK